MINDSPDAARVPRVRRPAVPLGAVAALVLAGLTLTGCGAGKDSAGTPPPSVAASSSVAVPEDITSLVVEVDTTQRAEPRPGAPLSLVEYFLGGGMRRQEEDLAIEQATAECMQRAGWRYLPAPGTHDNDLLTLGDLRAYRSTYGYGMVSGVQGNGDGGPNMPIYDSLSPQDRARYLEALIGPDTGVPYAERDLPDLPAADAPGCRPQAQRRVRSALPRYDEALKRYLSTNWTGRHPLLVDADRRWGRCMQAKGFDLDGERDLNRRLNEFGTDTRTRDVVLAEEKRLARADLTCRLANRWRVQRAVETALLAKVAERFPRYAQQIRQLPD